MSYASPPPLMDEARWPPDAPDSTHPLAIGGLVAAFIAPPVGLILSLVALGQTGPGKRGGRPIAIAGAILGGVFTVVWIIAIIAVSIVLNRTLDDVAEADAAEPAGREIIAFTLGQCFNDGSEKGTVGATVDCDQPHDNQVYHVFNVADAAAFPGDDVIGDEAENRCDAAFDRFVGVDYYESQYYSSSILPSAETWAAGDREVACFLYTLDGPTTGSAQDSGL